MKQQPGGYGGQGAPRVSKRGWRILSPLLVAVVVCLALTGRDLPAALAGDDTAIRNLLGFLLAGTLGVIGAAVLVLGAVFTMGLSARVISQRLLDGGANETLILVDMASVDPAGDFAGRLFGPFSPYRVLSLGMAGLSVWTGFFKPTLVGELVPFSSATVDLEAVDGSQVGAFALKTDEGSLRFRIADRSRLDSLLLRGRATPELLRMLRSTLAGGP